MAVDGPPPALRTQDARARRERSIDLGANSGVRADLPCLLQRELVGGLALEHDHNEQARHRGGRHQSEPRTPPPQRSQDPSREPA